MSIPTKVDAHAHIRIYNTDEQPDLLHAIVQCQTPQELARLTYLNLERFYDSPVAHMTAIAKKKQLLGYSTEELPAPSTDDSDDFTAAMYKDAGKEQPVYGATMIVSPVNA